MNPIQTIACALICACGLSVQARTIGPIVSDNTTTASTIYGDVQGYKDGEIFTFKGIPYAKATRFMPPTAPDKHEGVMKCRKYGPKAPQGQTLSYKGNAHTDNDFGFQFNLEPMDEDNCLVLNVWSKGLNDGKKRPVFVWFHGGGFSTGSAIDLPCYEGYSLADKGDIVVVTVNHRLNTLGYMDMSSLGGQYENSVNLGMQDLVKSLEWVRDNISNFGGDPGNVTIGGQSGGGGKVSTVMMMPSAKGLFHKAIVQSGSFARIMPNENGKLYAEALLAELGIKADEYDKLAAVPYERLVEAANKSSRIVNSSLRAAGKPAMMGMQGPVLDGKFIVGPGFDADAAPEVSREVPMMIGWNFNEFDFVGGKEDTMFRDAAINQAKSKAGQGGADVYLYLFNWKPKGNTLGACHGMELPFMFNNIDLQPEMTGATPEAYSLADKMSSAWIQFIKTGNPNVKSLPRWDPYTESAPHKMIFGPKPE
ncbi:MAG: carboxylesterase family protein [Clostridium sp.]|nr:carboxylesterase family protein [Clostridium sp.]